MTRNLPANKARIDSPCRESVSLPSTLQLFVPHYDPSMREKHLSNLVDSS
jgi:hypothetical protein